MKVLFTCRHFQQNAHTLWGPLSEKLKKDVSVVQLNGGVSTASTTRTRVVVFGGWGFIPLRLVAHCAVTRVTTAISLKVGKIYANTERFRRSEPLSPHLCPLSVSKVGVCGVYSEAFEAFSEMSGLSGGGGPGTIFLRKLAVTIDSLAFFPPVLVRLQTDCTAPLPPLLGALLRGGKRSPPP